MCAAALALSAAGSHAATIYKWVDKDGVTHYSDQPHPDAETVDVKAAQTYEAPPVPKVTTPSASQPAQPALVYQSCQIVRPENDEVFLNAYSITGSLHVAPELRRGDRVYVSLDSKRQEAHGIAFSLPVERGTHTLTATIEDSSGKVVCRSQTVTFHVRQPSVQAPNRANRPRF